MKHIFYLGLLPLANCIQTANINSNSIDLMYYTFILIDSVVIILTK